MLANLVAVPLTTFLVMPAGMLGLLAMPLGLEGPFFHAMALGCDGVLWIAHVGGRTPGASVLVRQWPGSALALLALGGLWLALWQRPWRWSGLVPVAAAMLLAFLARPPDLLVDSNLGMAAIRGEDGRVTLVEWRRDRLIRDSWLRHLGVATAEPVPPPGAGLRRDVACDEDGCIVALGASRVALAKRMAAVVEDCGRVDVVIARLWPGTCRGSDLIGPRLLRASGGLAVTSRGDGVTVVTVAERRGDWPWSRTAIAKVEISNQFIYYDVMTIPRSGTSAEHGPLAADELSLAELLLVVHRRRWLLLACLFLGGLVGIGVLSLLRPTYEARALLIIEPALGGGVGATIATPSQTPDSAVVDSQVQILASRSLAREALGALGLEDDPELTGSGGPSDGALAFLLRRGTDAGEPAPWTR